MRKEVKLVAIGILIFFLVIFIGGYFFLKDSFLFPWEKTWHITYYKNEFKDSELPVVVTDWGYRFLAVTETPGGKEIAWVWQMKVENLSKKDSGNIRVVFELKDSNKAVLASDGDSYESARSFPISPEETITISGTARSPLYAKQASTSGWRIWVVKD